MWSKKTAGFTLVECLIASAIAAISFLATLYILAFARIHNEMEQERTRAHQIVCQKLEIERYQLFTWTHAQSEQTIWDNGTPDDTSDDTVGTLELIVKHPETCEVLTSAPDPAVLVEIEATLTWTVRGGRLSGKVLRETTMTYKAP